MRGSFRGWWKTGGVEWVVVVVVAGGGDGGSSRLTRPFFANFEGWSANTPIVSRTFKKNLLCLLRIYWQLCQHFPGPSHPHLISHSFTEIHPTFHTKIIPPIHFLLPESDSWRFISVWLLQFTRARSGWPASLEKKKKEHFFHRRSDSISSWDVGIHRLMCSES